MDILTCAVRHDRVCACSWYRVYISRHKRAPITAMNAKGTKYIQVKAITIIKATDFIDVDSLNSPYRVCASWYRVCVS